MPYNNTPIAPPKDISGQVSLPLARVQKIINADPERLHTSKNAGFAIALATEMFIQHLATTTHNVVKAERKPRRNIQYRDVASAIAKTDNLEFLVDVVPKTITFKEYKKKVDVQNKAKEMQENGQGASDTTHDGDSTMSLVANSGIPLNGLASHENNTSQDLPPLSSIVSAIEMQRNRDAMEIDEQMHHHRNSAVPEEDGAALQLEMEMRDASVVGGHETPAAGPSQASHTRTLSGFTAVNGAG